MVAAGLEFEERVGYGGNLFELIVSVGTIESVGAVEVFVAAGPRIGNLLGDRSDSRRRPGSIPAALDAGPASPAATRRASYSTRPW